MPGARDVTNDTLEPAPDRRLRAAATARNRQPILDVLARVLPPAGIVLEVGSGTGEHAAFFAPRLPHLTWQPSDPEAEMRASIAAWARSVAASNIAAPLTLDAAAATWPVERADAVVCINVIHIAPWAVCEGLVAGAAALLPDGGVLVLYGPFKRDGRHTAPSNAAFDESLRSRDPAWGVRDMGDVAAAAAAVGFDLADVVPMPANNFSIVFRRRPRAAVSDRS